MEVFYEKKNNLVNPKKTSHVNTEDLIIMLCVGISGISGHNSGQGKAEISHLLFDWDLDTVLQIPLE